MMLDPLNLQPIFSAAQASSLPAPHWFIQFFKVLGFTLHSIPMNLWYAGLIVAVLLHLKGNEQGRRFAARLIAQMPVIIAFGVNLGVVPLLFVQVAYYKQFYPATIFMAWFWLGIIVLLIPAYYGVYAYAWGLRNGKKSGKNNKNNGPEKITLGWRRGAGWAAAFFFLIIGFIFANGLSLMDHVDRWNGIFAHNNMAGAALGTGLNVGDPTLWPRWLLMFGLALGTTSVWVLVDTFFLNRTADDADKRWAWRFAKTYYTVALIWVAAAGSWYVFGTWSDELRKTMFAGPTFLLTAATSVAMGAPWLLIVTESLCKAKAWTTAGIALAQVGVMALNAVSRQVVQNVNLDMAKMNVFDQKVETQWGPMALFLVVFVIGVLVLAWMILQVLKASANPSR
jgi:hypothetical protein